MALTPEQAAAYEQLEVALDNIEAVFHSATEGEFINGWVLVMCGSTFCDDDGPDEDEQEMRSNFRAYAKRAQLPALTRGILECYLDRFRQPEDS